MLTQMTTALETAYTDGQPAPAQPSAAPQTLPRTGARPLRFNGVGLCMAMSYTPGQPLWYEINVYRTVDQTFVVDVRCFTTSEDEQDRFTVFEATTFDDVMEILESYEPASDLRTSVDPSEESLSGAQLALAALALRTRIEEARRQYRGLVGQVLYELSAQ